MKREGFILFFLILFQLTAYSQLQTAETYYTRGVSRDKIGMYDEAIADFTKATELDTKYSIAWFQRGYWKEISGDLNGSLNDLNKAKELNPNDKDLYVSLAVTNYKLKNTTAACSYLNEAKNRGSLEADELILIMCK